MPLKSNLENVIKKLDDLPKAVATQVVKQTFTKALEPMFEAVKSEAPVKTGKLRDAIRIVPARNKNGRIVAYVSVGKKWFQGDTFYGGFVVFGHVTKEGSLVPPDNFPKRGFDKTKDKTVEITTDIMKDVIEDAVKEL